MSSPQGWAPTLEPAVSRIRANLGAVRRSSRHREPEPVSSAEELVDAAEAYAARVPDPDRRAALLEAARLLRRTDQVAVRLATELGHTDESQAEGSTDHDIVS
jgi:hypothetical protein